MAWHTFTSKDSYSLDIDVDLNEIVAMEAQYNSNKHEPHSTKIWCANVKEPFYVKEKIADIRKLLREE